MATNDFFGFTFLQVIHRDPLPTDSCIPKISLWWKYQRLVFASFIFKAKHASNLQVTFMASVTDRGPKKKRFNAFTKPLTKCPQMTVFELFCHSSPN